MCWSEPLVGGHLDDGATEFSDHGFRALPMVDENHKLIGVIPYKDLLAVMK